MGANHGNAAIFPDIGRFGGFVCDSGGSGLCGTWRRGRRRRRAWRWRWRRRRMRWRERWRRRAHCSAGLLVRRHYSQQQFRPIPAYVQTQVVHRTAITGGTPTGSQNFQSWHHSNGVRQLGTSRLGSLLPWAIGAWVGDGMGLGISVRFSYWGGYPFGWGGYWADYFCPYGPVYADGYPMAAYGYSYPDDGQYAANFASRQAPASRCRRCSPVAAENGEATATRVFSTTTRPGPRSRGAIIAMHCGWPATRAWNRRKMRRSTS